jgi:YidC/Oxa1 family membrane protein insertase
MDNPRIFLWLALLFLVWLNVDAWMKDYGRPGAPGAPAATAPATAPPAAGGGPASPLAESLPTLGAPAAGTPSTGPSGGGVPTGGAFAPGTVIHVVTDVLDMDISLTGGDIVRADLLEYPLKKDNPDLKVRLFNIDSTDSLFLYESGLTTGQAGRAEPNHKAQFTAARSEYRLEPGEQELRIPLSWTDGQGLSVTKTFVLRRGGYAIDVSYDIDNATTEAVPLSPYAQLLRHWVPVERSMFNVESYAFRGPAVYDGEKYSKLKVDDEEDQQFTQTVTGGWVAALQHHFVAAIVPQPGEAYRYALKVQDKDYLLRVVGPAQIVAAGGRARIDERLFVGPKLQEQLKEAGPELQRTADYGKLTILSQPLFWLLEKVHGYIGNWGWTIIIVTFLIKLVFYKLAETSGRSMAKMRTVAPRMKVIQERFKDDREGQARAMMELYKREKINPVAGCLPMIVQIPFFLAFYWVLLESVEMRQAPFMFWIQDLSSRDPFFILPLLMGGAMFLQFKLNPTPPDPVQAKVFAFMPIIMTAMFAWFPAGLVLYWLTNTVLSIAQQWKINRLVEAEEKKRRTN